ncbi:2-oxoglutarate dehydrogenase E1 component [Terriglobus saanensis]|uniref:oxoglutarate dehydrogenase (succinyl-transferring) n=1 Tax=Terriglobus saanensis (strain ATCC BAA-1853 / DSM 23119 / SP1PR4) TaxID=401053 RepID=E8V4R6_TERSS|nr:2-oxoglutarate dehydrogenase E1 component [Terriglobus saanensis]ADV81470.1 2-oxoglutarate dehydrogenase, E1 subunit [Terriglobus saanensis SP1PR4]
MAIKTPPQKPSAKTTTKAATLAPSGSTRETVFEIFRRWGYLQATLDPLQQYLPAEPFPIDVPEGDEATQLAQEARGYYCGNIALEFSHIASPEKRQWLQEQMEQPTAATKEQQAHTLTQLIKADLFEQVIQQRYLGTKRFSLEGLTALIPYLDRTFEVSAEFGVERSTFAMSHRGRLNVMVNTVGRSAAEIFTKFEDVDPRSTLGGGDVKYHMGATGTYTSPTGKTVGLHLASNPSHLEAVDPVVMGRARAKQMRIGDEGTCKILPLIIHGDAAFAGQGIWAETLDLATIYGYQVGGTIQVVVNNLLGFTAEPQESNSSRFSTDIAKRLPIPIFHVNAEDPDAVVRVAEIAAKYRAKFASDVVVDLVGYRRHGHSEVDDPTVTQPRRYARIKETAPLYQSYAKTIGTDASAEIKQIQDSFLEDQRRGKEAEQIPHLSELPTYWEPYKGGYLDESNNVQTGLDASAVKALVQQLTSYPADFHIHPKVKALLKQREEMGAGTRSFDYGMAELVAYASVLKTGTPVRLSGQDSQRGTFNQRHSVFVDTETELRYSPLQHLNEGQGRFEVYNSMLSEAAVLGFEYGYARDYPETLTLWEAQFGDFANGAQIIIDQFIAAGEAKWHLLSGLVMLLPHGYEGQGPEHSSARIERYLQLCATDNMIVAQPSNAAQYFHLLRRQALSPFRKPLIVFTPKSMLRHPDAVSPIADFAAPQFQNVLADNEAKDPKRILVCSGKIGHNLRVERAKRGDYSTAIVFVEQLYPWPEKEISAALEQYPNAEEIVWVQEEPANMGPLTYALPLLKKDAGNRRVLSIKRSAAASPATGSAKAHELEERALIELALGASSK